VAEKTELFLREAGISDCCLFGPEFEFYVLDNVEFRNEANHIEVHLDSAQAPWNAINSAYDPVGNNLGYKVMPHRGYHVDQPQDTSFDLRNTMVRTLEECGVPIKYHHSENGSPGQVEIELEFGTIKQMADRTQKLKYLVKNIAIQHGKTVTFMPKPFISECGSGMHVHMHMFNQGQPIFYDETGYESLSQTAMYAIGGILKHSAALMAYACPSTNSYKRMVPGHEAPVTICFGASNRTSVIRIPGYAKRPTEKRFEFRPPDATANPYLCFSAIVMAAIDGIQRQLDPVGLGFGPYDKNMYYLSEQERQVVKYLPRSLEEAADALEADHGFLLNGGVFSAELIVDQLTKIRSDAAELNLTPHPLEFQKYYDA
jgi:glutamine synthetase